MTINKVLYIGQLNPYSTSYFRCKVIEEILEIQILKYDILHQFGSKNKFQKSLAWRYFTGSIVININKDIRELIKKENYNFDLIWVDKGTFLYPSTIQLLKSKSKTLLHYTPDTAFFENNSRLFREGIHFYDFLVTTKSFELNHYTSKVSSDKVILISQGYQDNFKLNHLDIESKEKAISFIGLCEPYREGVISILLNNGFQVNLGGVGWERFVKKQNTKRLHYLGKEIFGESYTNAISSSMLSLGFLSKKFPELHTTRTFEIPACGTCLITERNEEIDRFFNDDECLKYDSIEELIEVIKYYLDKPNELQKITLRGYNRVKTHGTDYKSQISKILFMITDQQIVQ
jgi:spore maturation protein CgeB